MPTIQDVKRWSNESEVTSQRIAGRFSRRDLRTHAGRYVQSPISRVERKNGWEVAQELRKQMPTNLQLIIARSEVDTNFRTTD